MAYVFVNFALISKLFFVKKIVKIVTFFCIIILIALDLSCMLGIGEWAEEGKNLST